MVQNLIFAIFYFAQEQYSDEDKLKYYKEPLGKPGRPSLIDGYIYQKFGAWGKGYYLTTTPPHFTQQDITTSDKVDINNDTSSSTPKASPKRKNRIEFNDNNSWMYIPRPRGANLVGITDYVYDEKGYFGDGYYHQDCPPNWRSTLPSTKLVSVCKIQNMK